MRNSAYAEFDSILTSNSEKFIPFRLRNTPNSALTRYTSLLLVHSIRASLSRNFKYFMISLKDFRHDRFLSKSLHIT